MTSNPQTDSSDWDLVITAKARWLDFGVSELWRYRDLIMMLVRRDFVSLYKQTILGPIWFVVQPLLTTFAFTVVFNRIASIPTDGVPPFVFYLTGVVVWNFFSASLSKTADTFAVNASLFNKVYFPRLVVPVSVVASNLLTLAIQFSVLVLLIAVFGARHADAGTLLAGVLLIPLIAYIGLLSLGVGIAISSLTTRFRDMNFLVGFAIQLWLYATPIVYPLSQIPAHWRWVISLNPMTAPTETFRAIMLGSGTVEAASWAIGLSTGTVLVLAGLLLFSHVQKTSMDTV